MKQIIALALILASSLLNPGALASDVPPWLLQSNLIALQFTRDLAERNPEIGSMLGYIDFDALSVAVKDDLERDDEAFYGQWRKKVRDLLKREKHPEVRRDLRLLGQVFDSQLESIQLDRKHQVVPLYRLSRLVLSQLKVLDSPVLPERVKSAPVRFHRYVAGFDKGKPLAEAYESRIRFLLRKYGAKAFYPAKVEIEEYLRESAADMTEIAKILEKAKANGVAEDLEKFKKQVAGFNAFVTAELLPKATLDRRYPLDVFRWVLRSKSISDDETKLIRTGREAYAKTRLEMEALAVKVAAGLGLKDTRPSAVIAALKTKQLTKPEEVEKTYREAEALLSSAIAKRDLLTLSGALEMSLSTPEEGQQEPFPHLSHPPLAFSMGEKASIILPVAPSGKFPTDDFTYAAAAPALLAHEGRPGHEAYFQPQMDRGISVIRARYGYSIPSVEGWAFYAEDLVAPDLPPSAQLVILQMRAWCYARMFLDPEVHLGRMKPEAATQLLTGELGLSQHLAENEVKRFLITDPGQGVGYGWGYLKIQEAKAKVKKRLGKRFSERCFNDAVIGLGLLPVDWLDDELKSLKCPEAPPPFGDMAFAARSSIL